MPTKSRNDALRKGRTKRDADKQARTAATAAADAKDNEAIYKRASQGAVNTAKAQNEEDEKFKREAAAKRQAELDRKAEEARVRDQRCEDTRPQRLVELKEAIAAWSAQTKKAAPYAAWISKHCDYKDTRGVLVQRERTGDGVIVRTKRVGSEAEAKCDAPKAAAVTQEMVEWVLDYEPDDAIYKGTMSHTCLQLDRAAGINFLVRGRDGDGELKAILAR